MGVIVKDGGEEFEKIPTGMHSAICVNVFDMGYQKSIIGSDEIIAHKIAILWEIDQKNSKGENFTVCAEYTASLNQRANLRKILESWRGKAFTKEELNGFDLDNVKNKMCTLNLVEKVKNNGKTWVDVASVSPKHKDSKQFQVTVESGYVPKWVIEKIKNQIKEHVEKEPEHKEEFKNDVPLF